jgi:hypothetical protein
MKNLIVLIMCVVSGVMATSSEITQEIKDKAVQQFYDLIEEATSQLDKCKQSAANQNECIATYFNTYRTSVDELKSVLTPEDIKEVNEELAKEPLVKVLEEAGFDLLF